MRITINKIIEYCEKCEEIATVCSASFERRNSEISEAYRGEAHAFSEIAEMLKDPEHFKRMYEIVFNNK